MRQHHLFFLLTVAVALPFEAAAQDSPARRCSSKSMRGESAFDTRRVRELAGEYDLVFVRTIGPKGDRKTHRGKLVLWVQDSVRSTGGRFGPPRPGWERPIAGRFIAEPPDTDAWWGRMASDNLDHPGVMWWGGGLRFGDYDGTDGTGDNLRITHQGPVGFRGRWSEDYGIAMMIDTVTHQRIPNPAGYFCAYRRTP